MGRFADSLHLNLIAFTIAKTKCVELRPASSQFQIFGGSWLMPWGWGTGVGRSSSGQFEQVSSDDHQISVAGGRPHVWYWGGGGRSHVRYRRGVDPMSGIQGRWVPMSQYIKGIPPEQNDRQTSVKILPSRSFVRGP